MVDNYPSNSRSTRRERPEPAEQEETEKPDKKIEKVIEGKVVRKKKSPGKKFAEVFFSSETTQGVVTFVVQDVIIPKIKDMVLEAFNEGLERKFYGDTGARSRRSRPSAGREAYVPYNRVGPSLRRDDRRERDEPPRARMSREARVSHDFDEVVLESRAEADFVLEKMFEVLKEYEQVTVADLLGLIGETPEYTDESYGWVSLRGASVVRTRGGLYLLDLPRTEVLSD